MGDGAVASGLWWVATGKFPGDELEEEEGGGDLDEGRELTDRGADLGRFEEEARGLLR